MYPGARDSRVFVVVFAHRIRDVQTRFPRIFGTHVVGERADVRERQPGVFGHAVVRTEAVVVGERPRDRTGDVSPVPIRVNLVVRYASAHRKLAGLLKRAVPHVHARVAAPDDLADAGDPNLVKRRSPETRALHNLRRLPVCQPTQGAAAGRRRGSRRHPLRRAAGSQPVHRRVEPAWEDADDHLAPPPGDAREGVGVARRGPHAPLKRSSRRRRKRVIPRGAPDSAAPASCVSSPPASSFVVRRREHGFEEHAARVRVRRDGVLAQKRRDVSGSHRVRQLVQHAIPRRSRDVPGREGTHPRHPRERRRRRRRRRSPHGDVRRDGDDAGEE